MNFHDFAVGQTYSEKFIVSDQAVKLFAEITGDKNPVHLDDEYARSTRFGKRIAHGMLVASFISKTLGMNFPGPGTVLVKQQIKYRAPVYIDEHVEVRVTVLEVISDKHRLILQTDVFKEDGNKAIEAQSEILYEK